MENIKDILLPIIEKAGKIMTGAYNIEGGINEKNGDSANLVTLYDVAVQNYLIKEIKELFPTALFFAEEKENNASDLQSEYCFVIDPIDGTTNFVHNQHASCISLALFSHGEVIFAAIYNPYTLEMFHAKRGDGAYLDGEKISVSSRPLSQALTAFGTSPYKKDKFGEKTFSLARAFYEKTRDVRRVGSAALDLASIASGRYDIFFELSLSPWDIAAGYLLVKEAGGVITDLDGKEIDFTSPSSVLAVTPALYRGALEIVKENI